MTNATSTSVPVRLAKDYVTTALNYALDIGEGAGSVGHFFPLLQ